MKTLEDRIAEFLLLTVGFCDRELIEEFKGIVDDIANPKL